MAEPTAMCVMLETWTYYIIYVTKKKPPRTINQLSSFITHGNRGYCSRIHANTISYTMHTHIIKTPICISLGRTNFDGPDWYEEESCWQKMCAILAARDARGKSVRRAGDVQEGRVLPFLNIKITIIILRRKDARGLYCLSVSLSVCFACSPPPRTSRDSSWLRIDSWAWEMLSWRTRFIFTRRGRHVRAGP